MMLFASKIVDQKCLLCDFTASVLAFRGDGFASYLLTDALAQMVASNLCSTLQR